MWVAAVQIRPYGRTQICCALCIFVKCCGPVVVVGFGGEERGKRGWRGRSRRFERGEAGACLLICLIRLPGSFIIEFRVLLCNTAVGTEIAGCSLQSCEALWASHCGVFGGDVGEGEVGVDAFLGVGGEVREGDDGRVQGGVYKCVCEGSETGKGGSNRIRT